MSGEAVLHYPEIFYGTVVMVRVEEFECGCVRYEGVYTYDNTSGSHGLSMTRHCQKHSPGPPEVMYR